jgi:diamine N-acetyltransferase
MRITQTADYTLVANLNKSVHELHSNLYPDFFTQYDFNAMQETFKQVMNNESFIFLLVEDNQEAIGYAWLEIRNYPENAFRKEYMSLYVHQIGIEETKRNKGYGTNLMEEIYRIAKGKGIELIELDYWVKNKAAKDFYVKQGYKKSREFVYKEL